MINIVMANIIVILAMTASCGLALPYEIVAIGDSTTAPRNVGAAGNGRPAGDSSYGANDSGNTVSIVDETSPYLYVYADQIRDALPNYLTNDTINVYNEGIGGNRIDEGLARLGSDVQFRSPDLVVIQFGINDSAHDSGPGTPSRVALDFAEQYGADGVLGGGDDHPYVSRGNYTSNLTEIVTTLQEDGIDVILMTPNRITSYETVSEDRLTLYVQVVRDVAAAQGVMLVDVWTRYTQYITDTAPKSTLTLDGVHPNGLGQALVSRMLIPVIQELTDLNPARTIDPRDWMVDVPATTDLSWTPGIGSLSHDVYFSTGSTPAFIGNQVGTSYTPGVLNEGTAYSWRIDEVTASGTVTGLVWTFTTDGDTPSLYWVGADGDNWTAENKWSDAGYGEIGNQTWFDGAHARFETNATVVVTDNLTQGGITVDAGTLTIDLNATCDILGMGKLTGDFLIDSTGGQWLNFRHTGGVEGSVEVVGNTGSRLYVFENSIYPVNYTMTMAQYLVLAGNGITQTNSSFIINSSTLLGCPGVNHIGPLSGSTGSQLLSYPDGNCNWIIEQDSDSTFAGEIKDTNANRKTSIEKRASGKLTLLGNNTYTRGTTITAGALQFGDGGTTGLLPGTAVVNNGELILNRSDPITLSHAISGSGDVWQRGTGTLTLSGVNTHTGRMGVDGGGSLEYTSKDAVLTGTHVAAKCGTIDFNFASTYRYIGQLYLGGMAGTSLVTNSNADANIGFVGTGNGANAVYYDATGDPGMAVVALNAIRSTASTAIVQQEWAISDSPVTDVDVRLSGTTKDYANTTFEKKLAGTLEVTGRINFGYIKIQGGILRIGNDGDNIADSTDVELVGATLATGGYDETMDRLIITGGGTIDFSNHASSDIAFADSSGSDWSGTLSIVNFRSSGDKLRFGSGADGLTPEQLEQMSINGCKVKLDDLGYAVYLSSGTCVVIK
ncbi:MAG: GDSL-type esterase/lipase family protein [Kiritimatiellae bacterium]|nr:GDSL-type esterase/lipase family protein [Kiritimatiellia bacterium]